LLDAEPSDGSNLFLFLDSPERILVCHSRHLRTSDNKPTAGKVGEALKNEIQQAANSYRTRPPIDYALELNANVGPVWTDIFIEDALDAQTLQSYEQWKAELAAEIQQEVQDEPFDG